MPTKKTHVVHVVSCLGTGRMAQNTQTSNPVSPNATPGSARRTSLSAPAPKLCDLIREKEEKKEVYYSFEFFPPKTEQGLSFICPLLCSLCLLISFSGLYGFDPMKS